MLIEEEEILPKKFHFDEAPIRKMDGRKNRKPTLYTDGRKEKILLALKAGATERYAAGYGGVSLETLRRWRSKGEAANEDSAGLEKDMYFFAQACLEASANNALFLLNSILAGAKEDPELALKALPILHAQEYSQRNGKIKHEIEGTIDHIHSPKLNLANATLEELNQLEKIALRLQEEEEDIIDAEIIE